MSKVKSVAIVKNQGIYAGDLEVGDVFIHEDIVVTVERVGPFGDYTGVREFGLVYSTMGGMVLRIERKYLDTDEVVVVKF